MKTTIKKNVRHLMRKRKEWRLRCMAAAHGFYHHKTGEPRGFIESELYFCTKKVISWFGESRGNKVLCAISRRARK